MQTETTPTLDSLAILVQAIANDKKLLQWFSALAKKSAIERRNKIFSATKQMTENRENTKVVSTLFLLADENIFQAARQALIEFGHIKD